MTDIEDFKKGMKSKFASDSESTLNELLALINKSSNLYNSALMIHSRIIENRRKEIHGTESREKLTQTKNQINYSIIQLIDMIDYIDIYDIKSEALGNGSQLKLTENNTPFNCNSCNDKKKIIDSLDTIFGKLERVIPCPNCV